MTTWTFGRVVFYIACLAASVLAMTGFADFDRSTGLFDLKPFNLYNMLGAGPGVASSAVAAIAAIKGWGRK